MRNTFSAVCAAIAFSLVAASAAGNTREYSVQVSAEVQASPAQITLRWLQDASTVPAGYTVHRRAPGAASWGSAIQLPGTATTYTDRSVSIGTAYEYQIVKKTPQYTGYGYINAGIDVPAAESRGKLLLVVDRTHGAELANELARLQRDITGDGWTVIRLDVARDDSVQHVKHLIKSQYLADPANVKAVFLFGHVPVPYSGNIVPDGHYPDHQGAWPCDGYYADMDGVWTDQFVNDTSARDPRNRNVPGDGKFDQSTFPAPLKLMIGRVDLANMPGRLTGNGPATFQNECELLRNYLNKNHRFRNKLLTAPERGVVGDYFGVRDGEAFAASGWRNFAPFFGPANITDLPQPGTWIPTLSSNAYLWAYGCGSGSYTSIGGIGRAGEYADGLTTELVQGAIKTVFAMLYGSWLGDWDSEDNIQRAVLATPEYGLACVWSGRPHWFLQHMALGEPIGFSTLLTQNDGFTGWYRNQQNNCASWTHIALMGDPTLRMHVVAPPGDVTAAEQPAGGVRLTWRPSAEQVEGYAIYRAPDPNGPFTRLNRALVKDTDYLDTGAGGRQYTYMVRAVKHEQSASGTYFNPSGGVFASLTAEPARTANATDPAAPGGCAGGISAGGAGGAGSAVYGRELKPTAGVDTLWFDDALPTGGIPGGDGGDWWNWVSANPAPASGNLAHQSNIRSGFHQHYFDWAYWNMLPVNAGEVLFAYVYLDPANLPSEIMLCWNDGSWEHRAYWGANLLNFGINGTASRRYMGPLPAAGKWVRLEVPASQVGLDNSKLKGMSFTLYNGRATWDRVGKSTALSSDDGQNSGGTTNTPPGATNSIVWFDDALPAGAIAGAYGGDWWNWVNNNPAPQSGALSLQSALYPGLHQMFFRWATQPLAVAAGESLYANVYLDPGHVPSEVMLQWNDGDWEHRAYWGANEINWGTPGTAGRQYMGPLPAAGKWVRLEVPASRVGLEGSTIKGLAFTLFGGRATWDNAGKFSLTATNDTGSNTNSTNTNSTNVVDACWVNDVLPAGAAPGAEGGDWWNWLNNNPTPQSGTLAAQSALSSGLHQMFFRWATQPLTVAAGESLYAYVYLDPVNVPSEVMLQWDNGDWEHRAYWGANEINWGTPDTAGRQYMGPLPAAGKWVRLEVPASRVGLEGSTINGLAFTLFGGRAAWDNAGKCTLVATNGDTGSGTGNGSGGSSTNDTPVVGTNSPPVGSTNPPPTTTNPPAASHLPPGLSTVYNIGLQMPHPITNALNVLTPTLLELKLINTKGRDPARVSIWDWVQNDWFNAPSPGAFTVTANGQTIPVQTVGFKRRPLFAPLVGYDLRIDNSLYLQLAAPVSDNQVIEVKNPSGALWPASIQFATTNNPLRYSPAIHVNHEGYMPNYTKKAMVGYYLGSLGELNVIASSGFKLVDANTGATVHQGTLQPRPDSGWAYSPIPYQKVYEADFTSFNTPGQYRLVVPGMGGSLPFAISDSVAMNFARTYALGLYHQRCGSDNALPYTRHTHGICHNAPVAIPSSATAFPYTWGKIAEYASIGGSGQIAPRLTSPSAQLFPFVRQGTIDASGGHHDAGDYSKYTVNSAMLIHYLMFAADAMPGAGALDNLGIPESGDGISDLLQTAKWEADFLAKLQDNDGGFYFLVYPQNREYENNVMPDKGDPQLVWPKTSSATAASVAALAQCASSPAFKAAYPATAAAYLQKAKLGWQFLMNGIARYGKDGIYQKITHYGDDYGDDDELAWAACEMYLATGDPQYHQALFQWFPDPASPATFRWGWWRLYLNYGNAVRSYAFGARSGRLNAGQLNAGYLAKCEATMTAAADDLVYWSRQSAYGTSFPEATKRVQGAGWYFSSDQMFDIAAAHPINQKPAYLDALLANMNYEAGCNPANVSYVTGMGWKRQRDVVSQYAANDRRTMPPAGIPVGNVQNGFSYLDNYGSSLGALCFPSDSATTAPHPFYDRWGDSWNVTTEFVAFNQARGLAAYAFLAARTPLKTQAWKPVPGKINTPASTALAGAPITLTLSAPGIDLAGARIVWEARDQEPYMGPSFTFIPRNNGAYWVEAEAQLPDGRRVFAAGSFNADSPNIVWVDDQLPAGAIPGSEGGDTWNWVSGNPSPFSGALSHQSAIAAGLHQHFFDWATSTMNVPSTGGILYAYAYLDPNNPPREIMLEWNDGVWQHNAYWGENLIGYGTDGTESRRYMGPLPAAGQWVQLKVPASQVGLNGRTVKGMGFAAYGGRVTWDAAGVLNPNF